MRTAHGSKVILATDGTPAFLKAIENNWYEGSRWSPGRSWVWFPLQDPKRDLDRFTRYELNKHGRYLYKNSPFIRGLVERIVSLTIGSGIKAVFKTADLAKKQKYKAWWRGKSRNPHLGPRATMSQYQRAVTRARWLDGECFSIKTADQTTSETKVQGIESHRVTGGKPEQNNEGGSIDGLQTDKQGNVTSYKLEGVDQPYSTQDVVHHFTPNRLGQYRGETVLAAAINTARDVDDILALEKECVKDASSKKDIIERAFPEIDPEQQRLARYGTIFGTQWQLPNDDRTKDDYYNIQFGAKSIILKTGDKYTPYIPNRPGNAWEGFMAFLANTICLSTNFPPSVILPIDVGGTDIRRDLDIAQRVVDPIQLDLAYEFDDIFDYFFDVAVADGDIPAAPDDFSLAWHFPPKINVDRAQAQQDRNDVQAGLMSLEEYHGRYGDDGDEYDAQVIEEAKKRNERIKSAGFENVLEFLQVLSLNPLAFNTKGDSEPEDGSAPANQPTKGKGNAKVKP